ncbi:hypothetical protein [Caballeronia sp. 15711]|uniref:hypothetical protein n=1 Tax=Caballeronia sp. 15711 TaxID=3391029 RepID=UPI0039E4C467
MSRYIAALAFSIVSTQAFADECWWDKSGVKPVLKCPESSGTGTGLVIIVHGPKPGSSSDATANLLNQVRAANEANQMRDKSLQQSKQK